MASPEPTPSGNNLARMVEAITRREGGLDRGDLAALRRLDPTAIRCPAFWKLLAQHLGDALEALKDEELSRWAAGARAAVELHGLHSTRREHGLGRALVQAGYAPERFARLLRAEEPTLWDELRNAARFLAVKGASANAEHLVSLAVVQTEERRERIRRAIAADYYKGLETPAG